jgi:hypothetical protein
VRWGGHGQLHGRQGGRGKQRYSQVCHVLWVLRKILKVVKGGKNLGEVTGNAIDQLTSVRPDCGGFQTGTRIYFSRDTMRAGERS